MDFFNEFTSGYDLDNPRLKYKYFHSIRVMDNMILLAKNMNLPYKDIEVAKCIGLLHDIGRFEQYKKYASFNDDNLDHGDYAKEYLKKNNILKSFNIEETDYNVVYKAIANHNKFVIEDNLSNRELLFAKMIRDADKLDILYALGNKELKDKIREDDGHISDKVKEAFFKEMIIKNHSDASKNEQLVTVFGFVYDINFGISLNIIKANDYYNKIYNRLKNKELFKPYIDKINNYINERTR